MPSVTMGSIPIGITTTPETTSPLPTTYVAGATAPVQGAPVLPLVSINPADWPALDLTPPTNSSQVQEWISQIDWSQVPDIPVNAPGGCANATNAQAVTNASANGWWTCGGHTRSSDVVDCPEKNTWGLSYDDGPSPDTPRLLNYMVENDLKATFFVVGSRAISRPQMLQYEYMAGNQISVHTWAHPPLTTRTNEEIVAELGWSKEAIRQIIGVTPNTMRPPYGDIDDRVRAISLQMGLTPIIWTSVNGTSFDTFDWEIAGGVVNADTVVQKFQGIIDNATSLNTGFIVLEHDLYQQSTSLAIDYVLPYALAKRDLTLEPIYQCLGQSIEDVYIETASNTTDAAPVETTLDRGSKATQGAAAAGAAASGKSNSTGAADKTKAVSAMLLGLFGVAAVVVAL
ncbi:carbohydrate esterase family 4 protein [Cystobasidium minutum MCA 4210]|uniref:carbohydrate esterase family 4 protein n=1 Tax=Cystobasidium minutum MCA 4210 TaxID=1397322 RepID=UPI0034CFCB9E|eukprot:jgi/Rhomi1/145750/e_gw1.5.778.1